MRSVLLYEIAAVAISLAHALIDDPATPPLVEEEKFVGTYTIVSGERSGEKLTAEDVAGQKVEITADEIIGADKDDKKTYVAAYKLSTKKRPYRIDMTSEDPNGKKLDSQGLIQKEGDTVRIIYALPGGEAPTEFKTKDNQQMFVLKAAVK
jgi:uncharacterized protein (TIGR03067 family)